MVALEGLPEVVRAHADRLRLERRFGAAGAELFADGFQVVARWWERTPDVWSWTQRAWRAGLEARELRTGPLVIYPEAVQLAREMLRYQQRGERTPAARAVWMEDVQQLMAGWGLEDVDGWGELASGRITMLSPLRPPSPSVPVVPVGAVGGCWPWSTADSLSRPARCASAPAWCENWPS